MVRTECPKSREAVRSSGKLASNLGKLSPLGGKAAGSLGKVSPLGGKATGSLGEVSRNLTGYRDIGGTFGTSRRGARLPGKVSGTSDGLPELRGSFRELPTSRRKPGGGFG